VTHGNVDLQLGRYVAKEACTLRLGLDKDHPSPQGCEYEPWEPGAAPDIDDGILRGQVANERGRLQQMPGDHTFALVRAEEAQVHGVILQQIGQPRQSTNRLVRGRNTHLVESLGEGRFTCYHTV
jgi:hypothetical protein